MNTNYVRPRMFRAFVTSAYWTNKDEYDGVGQQQPWTFDEYVSNNLAQLKRDFKMHKQQLLR